MEKDIIKAQFPDFEPDLTTELSANAVLKTFNEGELLLRTGQYFKSSMLILNGLVKVYREDDEGNEFFIYYLQPGQACALSMVCASRQQTSQILAKAIKTTEVLAVSLELMDSWMTKYKSWANFVLETYRSRFEELLVTVDQIAFRAMDERLEFFLKKNAQTLQSNLIPLSHQQIAEDLSSSREVISRLLKKMEQLGKVKLHRSAVEWLGYK